MSIRPAMVIGIALLLAATWLLAFPLRGALDDARALRAAVPCASPDGPDSDCLRTVTARVDHVEKANLQHRKATYWLRLTEADGTSSRTRLRGLPQPTAAWAGARVEVTYWQGQIRYVESGSTRRWTTADPRDDYKIYATWGWGTGFFGLGFLWSAYWWARHSKVTLRASPWQVVLPLVAALCLAGFGALAPWITDSMAAAWGLVAVGALVAVAVCAVAALVLRRRPDTGDDTVHLPPSVPTAEQVFKGSVHGEVPYGKGGGGWLVAGPGCLATTPDPTGAFARRAVPRTLTPLRARPPYWTDPGAGLAFDGESLVLECEDNGVPVLVITHRTDMPSVLGALQPTPHSSGAPS
ncbi:hypothetical protein [Streptomyces sp. TRM64462]|uniref:hypothetical protein n=1 Tax=Streptomyces sp. TRM64462 TaxID=2741726 RepID=UPI001586BB71|nr:hypothetical protein [Streptomyces sp. TRM64462]